MSILNIVNGEKKYHDDSSRENVINYIFNPKKAISDYTGGSNNVSMEDPAASMTEVARKFNKDKGIRLRHFVLSFDPKELDDPGTADEIGIDIVDYLGLEYQAVYAVHENKKHLHIHIVMNSVSHIDGHRYRGQKQELYGFVNVLKVILRGYGIKKVNYQAK